MELILKYFPELTDLQRKQFSELAPFYQFWNNRINVISRKDINSLYEKHVLHSLSIGKLFLFTPGIHVLDVGTGGGFPGIPLSILFPEVNFMLIDSIGKKIEIVKALIDKLKLTNVKAVKTRVENLPGQFDFVVSRAVTSFPVFVNWTDAKISPENRNLFSNGIIYLKGGEFEEDIKSFKTRIKIYNISEIFSEPFFETKKIIYLPLSE
jgi:16S rRNA (guanine527-N7)-methyltransferase